MTTATHTSAALASDFDEEELGILESFNAGHVVRSLDAQQLMAAHRQYAANTLRKDARINIRLSTKDLKGIQSRALAEGIPYQTLAASVLHKFIEGRLVEARV
jgi:predicted DNA binding CopG/RHH family protein